jgi:hypothetical protein
MLNVRCKRCGSTGTVASLAEVGTLRLCECCPIPHDHDVMANMTGIPCRPVHIEAPAGFQHVALLSSDGHDALREAFHGV